ncbi:hypothetical protein Tco_0474325 [Tanacetum coccineum]
MNQNFYEPNLCYNSISSSFNKFQPPQFPVIYQPPQETITEILQARKNLMEVIQAFLKKYDHIPPREKCMALLLAEERFLKVKQALEKGQNQPDNAAKICTPYWRCPIFDADDDEEYTIQMREYYKNSPVSSVEDLNLIPSEFEDLSDIESECDVPVCDDFTTFSNPLFDSYDNSTSSNDESYSDEDVLKENFKIYSNTLFDEEIIFTKIDPHHFNAKSDLIESLLNRDTSIVSSPKFDSLLKEFSSEFAHIVLISPEELNSENSNVVIESFSPSPIPVEGSDSLMREIDIFLAPDDSIAPGIENDDYDSEGDILEELLNNDSLSLPKNESFYIDRYYDPSSPRPPAKPSDDDGIYFDAEPDTGILTVKVIHDISERYVLKPIILPTQPTLSLCPVIDTLPPFSSKNEDKVFNPGILASKEEKSPHLLSHRGFKAFQIIFDFSESPMMIYGGNIPILDVLFLHFYPP